MKEALDPLTSQDFSIKKEQGRSKQPLSAKEAAARICEGFKELYRPVARTQQIHNQDHPQSIRRERICRNEEDPTVRADFYLSSVILGKTPKAYQNTDTKAPTMNTLSRVKVRSSNIKDISGNSKFTVFS